MELERRAGADADHRHQLDQRPRCRRQAIDRERQYIGPLRIADDERSLPLPQRGVVPQHLVEILGHSLGSSRAPEVAQRIDPCDRNARIGERRSDLLVDPRPAAIAREQHGKRVTLDAGGHLDDRQPCERAWCARHILGRRAGDRCIGVAELLDPCLGVVIVVTDARQLHEARALHLGDEGLRLRQRTLRILGSVNGYPGCRQLRRREQLRSGTVRAQRVAQIAGAAERLAKIQIDTERHRQCPGEGAARGLREHRVGHAGARRVTDEDGSEVRRQLVVGLDVVTEVLQVTVRKHAVAPVLLEVGVQLRGIDARHHRALVGEPRGDAGKPRVPPAISGQQERDVQHRPVGQENRDLAEASVADRFRSRRIAAQQEQGQHQYERESRGGAHHCHYTGAFPFWEMRREAAAR